MTTSRNSKCVLSGTMMTIYCTGSRCHAAKLGTARNKLLLLHGANEVQASGQGGVVLAGCGKKVNAVILSADLARRISLSPLFRVRRDSSLRSE